MEVQVAWLDVRTDDPIVTVTAPVDTESTVAEASPGSDAPIDPESPPAAKAEPDAPAEEQHDDYAVPVPSTRGRPPRMPGAAHTMPPMPLAPSIPPPSPASVPTKPPPPPRRTTQEVEMSWVELVDTDLSQEEIEALKAAEDSPAVEVEGELPDLRPQEEDEKPEITRVEQAPVSTQRLEAEREVVRRQVDEAAQEGPPLEAEILAARAEAARREAAESEEAERMREEALAARKRDQDARDRELRQRRKAEREKERLAQEAMAARRAEEKKQEEDRISAMREGRPQHQILDLSGIDAEIDFALESVLGPNLSVAPPPDKDDKDKK